MSTNGWNRSERSVIDAVGEAIESGRPGVLATIIDVEGNAYRRPGAKLLIEGDGEAVGSVTAGCLEDEIIALAQDVLEAGEPRVETFDLMEDDDDVWGLGIGCNGIIDILLEPIGEDYLPAVEAARGGETVAIATVVESDADELPQYYRAIYRPEEGIDDERLPAWAVDEIEQAAETLIDVEKAQVVEIGEDERSAEVFVDSVVSPPEVVLFGTGPDVDAVTDLAQKSGFKVTVVGFRGATATEEEFPEADRVVSTSPANVGEELSFDDRTYTVVMTHNFLDDRLTIDELTQTDVAYIGLMGPRDRFEEMLEEFESEGRSFDQDELDRIYTPVGLNLGGGEPYQIAHAIVAEILAVHNDRPPIHLKEREGPIHDRIEVETD